MPSLINYYAHPGHRYSRVNRALWAASETVQGITRVDLYAEYPRHDIHIAREQQRLSEHDVIVLQFPLFWYSAPSLVKEWIDLTLQAGFAFGAGGDKLAGKWLMLATTAAGPEDAYTPQGYQTFPLRSFLIPFEQTANLCKMRFAAPYVLYGALKARPEAHAAGFVTLLEALRDGRLDLEAAAQAEVLTHDTLPLKSTV